MGGYVVGGRIREWCVCVGWDVFIVENVFREFCELCYVDFYVVCVLLFEHVPEFFRFVFKEVW
jgi:hypothetical protein